MLPCGLVSLLPGRYLGVLKTRPRRERAVCARPCFLLSTSPEKEVGSEGSQIQPNLPSRRSNPSPSGAARFPEATSTEVSLRRLGRTWPQVPATAGDPRPLRPCTWPLRNCERGAPISLSSHRRSKEYFPVGDAHQGYAMRPRPGCPARIRASPCLTPRISTSSRCRRSCVIRRLPASSETGLLGRVHPQTVRTALR